MMFPEPQDLVKEVSYHLERDEARPQLPNLISLCICWREAYQTQPPSFPCYRLRYFFYELGARCCSLEEPAGSSSYLSQLSDTEAWRLMPNMCEANKASVIQEERKRKCAFL